MLDTPSAYGSVHSPFKQPAGARLARAALAVAYNQSGYIGADRVDPGVDSIAMDLDNQTITLRLKGLGKDGIELRGNNKGQTGFEVLFSTEGGRAGSAGAGAGGGAGIWYSAAVLSATASNVVLEIPNANVLNGGTRGSRNSSSRSLLAVPVPVALRYLWYDTPCGNYAYQCPLYTAAPPLGSLPGDAESLPLGPFIQSLA